MGSALAIGTVHVSVLLVVSALALAGGLLSALSLNRLPTPAVVLSGLGLFSLLQAVPLPARWVERLSPVSAQVWLRCLTPFGGQEPTHFPISLDAGASVAEALKWLTYAAVYVMAARARARRGAAWLAALLFASGVLIALITLLHGAADISMLYGVYKPNFAVARWSVGPLLNSNNFAGYVNIGLFAGAALLISGKPLLPRVPSLVGIGTIVTALVLSGSRGGILSAFAGGIVIAVWWFGKSGRERPRAKQMLPVALTLVGGLSAALAFGNSKNWQSLSVGDVDRKISVWRWSLPMIREHVWFGVGRGAFESAFPPYRGVLDNDWTAVFSHAENFVIQWIAEWGLPVGLAATIVIVGYLIVEWFAARHDRLRFVLLTGVGALMLQNLADLGLEIPAVAIAGVVALAAGDRGLAQRQPQPNFGRTSFALSAPLFVVWAAAILWARWPVEFERREMSLGYRELAADSPEELDLFRHELRSAMWRHPGESFFPLLGSVVAYRARDESPLPWIARAIELGPTNGHVHFVLAQLLGAHKATRQAMLHLRLATEYDGSLGGLAGARAAQWATSLDVLLEAIPTGYKGDVVLAAACAKTPRIELKLACFRQATLRSPDNTALQGQFADTLLLAIRSRQWPCNGDLSSGCAQEADGVARAIARLEPKSWRPGYIIAKILMARGEMKAAAELLARVCPGDAEGQECAQESVSAALATSSDEAIVNAADKYAARACETGAACAGALDWLGIRLEAAGKLAFAINYYTRAAEVEGTSARWLLVAERAVQAGLPGVARQALDRADRSPDANGNSHAHVELLRRRLDNTRTL